MRGKKSEAHRDPADPPRRRANKRKGHGTYENDRPPIIGTFGRESGQVRFAVIERTDKATLHAHVSAMTHRAATCYTDEWRSYRGLPRTHATVCHAQHEWARDDDGDGFNEVHTNTSEGGWTTLRNFLRPFRGVHKKNLKYYVAMCEHRINQKQISPAFICQLVRSRKHESCT
jgi:transposase